jgi:hypothetical protein
MSHRLKDGSRKTGIRGYKNGDTLSGQPYTPPEITTGSNVIDCRVGGGQVGSMLCHENEAPFAEKLAEHFIRSFCKPGGIVLDPFLGSDEPAACWLGFVKVIRQLRVDLSVEHRQAQLALLRELRRALGSELCFKSGQTFSGWFILNSATAAFAWRFASLSRFSSEDGRLSGSFVSISALSTGRPSLPCCVNFG